MPEFPPPLFVQVTHSCHIDGCSTLSVWYHWLCDCCNASWEIATPRECLGLVHVSSAPNQNLIASHLDRNLLLPQLLVS